MSFDNIVWIVGIAIAVLFVIVPILKKKSQDNSSSGDRNQNVRSQHSDDGDSGDAGGGPGDD
ncbi:MAG: hypothetical protein COA52_18710 [Hyphomicrobiales bacterium]|nr:MAG: hypothetical protein COA52_18710 [Hyphomicrobiales bacterium]